MAAAKHNRRHSRLRVCLVVCVAADLNIGCWRRQKFINRRTSVTAVDAACSEKEEEEEKKSCLLFLGVGQTHPSSSRQRKSLSLSHGESETSSVCSPSELLSLVSSFRPNGGCQCLLSPSGHNSPHTAALDFSLTNSVRVFRNGRLSRPVAHFALS